MNYEYNESLKEDLQHLYEIPTGVWKYKEKLEELDEVYAKAAALLGIAVYGIIKLWRMK